jgi:uncharacterized protein (TIGR02118 family)
MLEGMERWAILLLAPPEADPEVWNRRLLDLACDLSAAVGVEDLVAHLRDEEARSLGETTAVTPASYHALVEIGGDQRARAAVDALGEVGLPQAYRVEQRRVKAHPRTWPDGARTPGVEIVSAMRRLPGLSHADFDAHWRDRHAPLAREHHPGMWEYRQNAVQEILTPGSPELDGIAVVGFPTALDCRTRLYDSPEGEAVIFEDLARFLDLGRSEAAFTGEYVLRS